MVWVLLTLGTVGVHNVGVSPHIRRKFSFPLHLYVCTSFGLFVCSDAATRKMRNYVSRSSIRIRHYQVLINEQNGFHKHNNLKVVDIRRPELFQARKLLVDISWCGDSRHAIIEICRRQKIITMNNWLLHFCNQNGVVTKKISALISLIL